MRSLIAVGSVFGAVAPALAESAPAPVVVEAEATPPAQPAIPAQPATPAMTDEAITSAITGKLQDNRALRHTQVTVASSNGNVTLVGTVPSDFVRDQIVEAARTTPGVVRIDNQLRLEISSPSAPTRN